MNSDMILQAMRKAIQNSQYLVCLQGISLGEDCGCMNYRKNPDAYDVEIKYGYSPEEMFSSTFYNTRPNKFFEFYRNEMLMNKGEPDETFKSLARMEEDGRLKAIITREMFSLAKRAGCRNVLEFHGNIFQNKCPRCQQVFPLEYIANTTGVPICHKCNVPVRPQVRLVGEMVDNQLITRGADEVNKADVLLVIGTNLKSYLCNTTLKYFQGNKLILINENKHYSDHLADLVMNEKPRDILPLIYP